MGEYEGREDLGELGGENVIKIYEKKLSLKKVPSPLAAIWNVFYLIL